MGEIQTAILGAIGFLFFIASFIRDDRLGQCYGMVMLTSWLMSLLAVVYGGPEVGAVAMVLVDFAMAIGIMISLDRIYDIRGERILALFAVEMVIHLVAALCHVWGNVNFHFLPLNIVYVMQVAIGGGRNVLALVNAWVPHRGRRDVFHSRLP